MKEYQSLAHTRWNCKYHVVFIPNRRKKKSFGTLRRHLGEIFRELEQHKESAVVGYIKGKSALARRLGKRTRNFTVEMLWARGYFVSTVGLDEEMVRADIRTQEAEDERYNQMRLGV